MPLYKYLTQKDVVTCSPSTSIEKVAMLMRTFNVGSIVIEDDEIPIGIVTDRDLVMRCMLTRMDVNQTQVSDIMTYPVDTVCYDDSIYDVIEHMNKNKIRRVCVIDGIGKALSILSAGDIYELLAHELSQLTGASSKTHKSKLFQDDSKMYM